MFCVTNDKETKRVVPKFEFNQVNKYCCSSNTSSGAEDAAELHDTTLKRCGGQTKTGNA